MHRAWAACPKTSIIPPKKCPLTSPEAQMELPLVKIKDKFSHTYITKKGMLNFVLSSGKESTFLPLQDMWFEGYFAFESLLNSAHFIRRCGEQLLLQKYENSHFFKEDSSFKLTRKRCIGKNELKIAYTCNHRKLGLSFLSSVSCWRRGDFP